tara:strand:+ start:744 stop:980 length:237 start_codon:yes stop_codon:yes gene_type:complete
MLISEEENDRAHYLIVIDASALIKEKQGYYDSINVLEIVAENVESLIDMEIDKISVTLRGNFNGERIPTEFISSIKGQ